MKKVVNVSEADLKSVIDEVAKTGQEIVLGKNDKPVARLVPMPDESSTSEFSAEVCSVAFAGSDGSLARYKWRTTSTNGPKQKLVSWELSTDQISSGIL